MGLESINCGLETLITTLDLYEGGNKSFLFSDTFLKLCHQAVLQKWL